MSSLAFTHAPSQRLAECQLSFRGRQPIDINLACKQHDAYRLALQQAGYQVVNQTFNRELPDSCFVEDVAVVLDELIVLASMGAGSRRAETETWKRTLADHGTVVELPVGARLEGGDVLRLDRQLVVGLSGRTNGRGAEALQGWAGRHGYTMATVQVQGCLHLKTACTALDSETLLLNPSWIQVDHLPKRKRIVAADPWGANVIPLPTGVLTSSSHAQTLEQLDQHGYPLLPVDISEFEKAEAGVTCLSILM